MQNMVELKALRPFVGSYECSLAEADSINERLVERNGTLVKEQVARKRFAGLISVERPISRDEQDILDAGGELRPGHELSPCRQFVTEHPTKRTVFVPVEVADNLISRGLAEKVAPVKRSR